MSESLAFQSAFVQVDFGATSQNADRLSIVDEGALSHINLRGNSGNQDFAAAVLDVVGFSLPITANTYSGDQNTQIIWLGPNEWLILSKTLETKSTIEKLRTALDGQHSSVNDVSGGNAVLTLKGKHARELLSKGCPMDLHQRKFNIGQCAQTVIGKAGMTLLQISDLPVYTLIVRRSFADYIGLWLIDAAREFVEQ